MTRGTEGFNPQEQAELFSARSVWISLFLQANNRS
jgi:hypothetical protein